jgi:hypothetical protein
LKKENKTQTDWRSAIGYFQDVPIRVEEEQLLDAGLCRGVLFVVDLLLVKKLLDSDEIIRGERDVIHPMCIRRDY